MAIFSACVSGRKADSIFKNIVYGLGLIALLTVYFTGGDLRRLQQLQSESIKVEKHAVVILVPDNDEDLNDLKFALRSLRSNKIVQKETPILIFHEDSFPVEKKWEIMKWTLNPISFHLGDFSFPEGFSPDDESDPNSASVWGYSLTNRFWIYSLWTHSAVRQFDTIMRIDTDSCFVEPGFDVEDLQLPAIRGRYVYRSSGPSTGVNVWIDGLFEFAENYMEQNNITPKHPELWERTKNMWYDEGTLPVFSSNFEVNRVSFFLRHDVMMWHHDLTDSEPFGVFNEKWGDAQTRVLTMAMFGGKDSDEDNVLMKTHPGYRHGRGICEEYFAPKNAKSMN